MTNGTTTTPSPAMSIHPESYPHIFDTILEHLPRETLIAVRGLNRYLRDRADVLLCRHASVFARPGNAQLAACLGGGDGRLPYFYKFRRGGHAAGGGDGDGLDYGALFKETRALSVDAAGGGRVVIGNQDSANGDTSSGVSEPGLDISPLIRTAPLEVIRTYEAGDTGYGFLSQLPSPRAPFTWSHFVNLASRTNVTTAVPVDKICKLVLNLDISVHVDSDMDRDDGDDDDFFSAEMSMLYGFMVKSRAGWGSGYLHLSMPKCVPGPFALEHLVVRFGCRHGPLPDSFKRPPPRGPVRAVSSRIDILEPIYYLAKRVLIQPYVDELESAAADDNTENGETKASNSTARRTTRLTIVDFPDPQDVHPRQLGLPLSATISYHETVESMFKQILASFMVRPFPFGMALADDQIAECLSRVEFIDSAAYAARVGEETFQIETDAGVFGKQWR